MELAKIRQLLSAPMIKVQPFSKKNNVLILYSKSVLQNADPATEEVNTSGA